MWVGSSSISVVFPLLIVINVLYCFFREKLLDYLYSLKQPDGSFIMHIGGEVDVRCVGNVSSISFMRCSAAALGSDEIFVAMVFVESFVLAQQALILFCNSVAKLQWRNKNLASNVRKIMGAIICFFQL